MEFLIAVIVAALIMGLVVVPLFWHANRRIAPSAVRKPTEAPARPQPKPKSGSGRTHPPEPETIDVSRIEGKLSKSASRKVGGFVERNPGDAASVIKKWMNSED